MGLQPDTKFDGESGVSVPGHCRVSRCELPHTPQPSSGAIFLPSVGRWPPRWEDGRDIDDLCGTTQEHKIINVPPMVNLLSRHKWQATLGAKFGTGKRHHDRTRSASALAGHHVLVHTGKTEGFRGCFPADLPKRGLSINTSTGWHSDLLASRSSGGGHGASSREFDLDGRGQAR